MAHCFYLEVPEGALSHHDVAIDAVEDVTGAYGVLYLQHLGGCKYLVCVRSQALSSKLSPSRAVNLGNQRVLVDPMGPPVVFVTICRLPPYVHDDILVVSLAPCGNGRGVQHVTFRDNPRKFTGARVVRLEMRNSVPIFMNI
ncbi:hypothetical protein V5799_025134 [Amblyomma americanum]|uniref:Uncharacterized protein n=1 Tax=Amblyomma americanum TaxID=6943 RepID=A0AAQ4EA21_AMBAM